MRSVTKKLAAVYLATATLGVMALFGHPSTASAECTIECESCTCNLKTGVCDCTNCTLKGCKPGEE